MLPPPPPVSPTPAERPRSGLERESSLSVVTTSPAGAAAPAKKPSGKEAYKGWALEGVASLRIDLDRTGQAVTFRSLGAEPRLGLVVINEHRIESLAWGLALAVLVVGMAMTTRSVGRRVMFVIGVALVATLVPVITVSLILLNHLRDRRWKEAAVAASVVAIMALSAILGKK